MQFILGIFSPAGSHRQRIYLSPSAIPLTCPSPFRRVFGVDPLRISSGTLNYLFKLAVQVSMGNQFYLSTLPQKCHNYAYLGVSTAGCNILILFIDSPLCRGEKNPRLYDCGFSLAPPQIGSSSKFLKSMFLVKNRTK